MSYYPLALEPDDNDTLLVTCPKLPEVTTFGETAAEAIANGQNAVLEALAARLVKGQHAPRPRVTGGAGDSGPVAVVGFWTEVKVELSNHLLSAKVTRAELARRMGVHREQVDRLFRLDHVSKPDQIEAAFDALDLQLGFGVLTKKGEPVKETEAEPA